MVWNLLGHWGADVYLSKSEYSQAKGDKSSLFWPVLCMCVFAVLWLSEWKWVVEKLYALCALAGLGIKHLSILKSINSKKFCMITYLARPWDSRQNKDILGHGYTLSHDDDCLFFAFALCWMNSKSGCHLAWPKVENDSVKSSWRS